MLQFSVIAARKPWAETHKDTIVRFARAYADGYRFMRNPKNWDAVGKMMVEMTDAKPDMTADILKLYYQPERGVMPKQAEIKMDGIAKVIQLLADTGQIAKPAPPATRFVDLQYLKAAGLQ